MDYTQQNPGMEPDDTSMDERDDAESLVDRPVDDTRIAGKVLDQRVADADDAETVDDLAPADRLGHPGDVNTSDW